VDLLTTAKTKGTARAFLTTGELGAIPVWTTSCAGDAFTPCAVTDGGIPPWAPDMSGHLVKQATQQITRGVQVWSIPLTKAQRQQLAKDGRLLVSYETATDQVQAFDVRLSGRR
jgi:hypothetical protein